MRRFFCLISFPLLFLGSPLAAEEIRSFDVTVQVMDSGSLYVSEQIEYDFGREQRHGIYRDIPYKVTHQFGYRDIGLSHFQVRMDGKAVSWREESASGDAGPMVRLKIGHADRTIAGNHVYTIDYQVAHGVLAASGGHDAIRWNVTGTGWKVPIRHATATVFLPPSLSRSLVRHATFSGPYGSRGTSATGYWSDEKTFVAEVSSLGMHEGLTFELAYPPGLLGQSSQLSGGGWLAAWLRAYWHWLVFFAGVIVMLTVWWRNGRDPHTGPVPVGYEPPKGLEAAQVGLLRDQSVDGIDIGAAVLELARDGYLRVEHEPSQYLGLKPEKITLHKLKDNLGELPRYKHKLLKALFDGGASLVLGATLSPSRAHQINEGIEVVKEKLYAWSAAEGLMREDPKKTRSRAMLYGFLSVLPLLGLGLYDTALQFGAEVLFMLLFISAFMSFGFLAFIDGKGFGKLFGIIWIGFSSLIFFGVLSEIGLFMDAGLLLQMPVFSQVLLLVFVLWMARHMPARTALGTKVYARVLGYREFMQRVDQELLARHIEKDPLYLDRTLPYAVALGVVDQWVKRFEDLKVVPPQWYAGDIHTFASFSSSIESVGSVGSTSSGGGSGGGGFSGGGGGGGGGGSW